MNEILTLLGLFAGFILSFAAAFVLAVGLPVYGICVSLKFLVRGKIK